VFVPSTPFFYFKPISSASLRYDVPRRPTFVVWQESQLKYPFRNMVSLFGVPLLAFSTLLVTRLASSIVFGPLKGATQDSLIAKWCVIEIFQNDQCSSEFCSP
jgi:hypothetical protein